MALTTYPGTPPKTWLRYVDDTLIIINKEETDGFFRHINNIDNNIKFTEEESNNNTMPFLDCQVSIRNKKFYTKVYKKSTHTDQYLHFQSNHPLIHKLGVIRTLTYRANTIITEEQDTNEEHQAIKSALLNCGYPGWAFDKAKPKPSAKPRTNSTPTNGSTARVTLPYIRNTSERIAKAVKPYGINVSHKPTNTLRQHLVKVKDKMPYEKHSNIVYRYQCSSSGCNESYIGETKQSLKARASQHSRPHTNELQESAIYSHKKSTGHNINIKDFKIVDREEGWFERGVREAVYERLEAPSLNRRGGLRFHLSHTWDRALRGQVSRRVTSPQEQSHNA